MPAHAWRVVGLSGGFDSSGVALTEKAASPIKAWLRETRPELTIQCSKGKRLDVWLEIGASLIYSGEYRYGRVRYRFDGGKPISELWQESTVSGTYGTRKAEKLMAAMSKAKTLEFEVTPHNGTAQTVTFDLSDFNAALTEFRAKCK